MSDINNSFVLFFLIELILVLDESRSYQLVFHDFFYFLEPS